MPALPALTPSAEDAASPAVEIGMYRDGDNNLDEIQSVLIDQARDVTRADPRAAFFVENATRGRANGVFAGPLRVEEFSVRDGRDTPHRAIDAAPMSRRETLANFTAKTLDAALRDGARSAWLDLVDHGAGDGGAFETSDGGVMREDDIAGAIKDGVARHAADHPEDATRKVDGVLFNACLMATCGMESALAKAGVSYLAASPEAMIAPGVASGFASVLADHAGAMEPRPTRAEKTAFGRALVADVMGTRYAQGGESFSPAAAFDVFDLDKKKIATMEAATRDAFAALAGAAETSSAARSAIRADARRTPGMARDERGVMPWHADRPAEAVFADFAADGRLPDAVRATSAAAGRAIEATVLAHAESGDFAPFAHLDYRDAAGPTIHLPTTPAQVDPWAPRVSETDTAFAKAIGAPRLNRALA